MIEKFTIARDDQWYLAFPDVCLTLSGKLVCVFAECRHHRDRSYTRIMRTESTDRGRSWSPKAPLTEPTTGLPIFWNNPRITVLRDGRLAVLVDKLFAAEKSAKPEECRNYLFFSSDEGRTWSEAVETPARGIVPDKLLELQSGRWILSCHYQSVEPSNLVQRLWWSDDQGHSWHGPVMVGRQEGLNLCEATILPMPGENTLVAFMRENSFTGMDCYKTISHDAGEHWSEPIRFPIPACHRPVAGCLHNGKILITHRYMQGGKGWVGHWTQNFFGAVTDPESALALSRKGARTRIFPIDYDRSPESDLGYSGWVQFPDQEIYVVNYVLDDWPRAQIRGYAFRYSDIILD